MKVEARSVGPIASQILKRSATAKVIASFEQSFYLETDGHLICVASDGLYDGPINVLVRRPAPGPAWSDVKVASGQRWMIADQVLSCIDGPRIDIDLGKAVPWHPKPTADNRPKRRDVRLATADLRARAASRRGSDGLLDLVLHRDATPKEALDRAALGPLQALVRRAPAFFRDGDIGLVDSLNDLLGLGPGLTPSGDDLIAGFLIACHHLGYRRRASNLWRRLQGRARDRTTLISLAHLSAAGQGLGAAPVHDLLDALVENRSGQITLALDAVAKIGHSSGLDAVGGLLLSFDAWIAAGDVRAVSAA